MSLSLSVLLASMALAPAPSISSNFACPDAAAVDGHLRRLFPAGVPAGFTLRLETATDAAADTALRIELLDGSSRIVSERRLAGAPSCAAAAEEVALVAATWLADLPPQEPTAVALPLLAPALPASLAAVSAAQDPRPSRSWTVGVATGIASPADLWITQAFALETRWLSGEPSGFYLAAGAFGTWPRARNFDGGSGYASWYRVRFIAEAGRYWRWDRFGATLGGGIGGGWTIERGDLIPEGRRRRGDGALVAQGRLSYSLEAPDGPVLWLGARVSYAFNHDRRWNASPGATPNSAYEGALLAGCDFFLIP
jgi:hypothetical protein